jgi:hypothetical protein
MTTVEQNEAARQINQDVQRDNGMLPETADESACKTSMLHELTHTLINPGGTLCCAELAEFDSQFIRFANTIKMGNENIPWRFCPWCGKPLENVQTHSMITPNETLSRIGWNGHNTYP